MLADESAGGAGMVEMDVGEEQVADVGQGEPPLGKAGPEGRDRGCRPAVEQGETVVGLDEVGADDARSLLVEEIDRGGKHRAIFAASSQGTDPGLSPG